MEEGTNEFLDQLENALNQRKELLEKQELPKLRELYRLFHLAFKSFYNLLLRKAIIQEDPYKYDQKISEVEPPPQGPFMESEKSEQMSIRLSMLESQIDFLINYYQFSVEFLNLERLKRILGITNYIRWDQLSESSTNLNTRTLAEMIGRIKGGPDSLSTGILVDSLTQLDKSFKEIMGILKQLSDYHREYYKLNLRQTIFHKLNLNGKAVMSRQEEAIKAIRRKFAEQMGDIPFYAELVKEIFDEEFSPQAERLRSELLEKVTVKEDQKQREKQEFSFKSILLEALRILASCTLQMDDAVKKLMENSLILESRKLSFGERFKKWLVKMVQGNKDQLIYEVEYFDVNTSTTKTEEIPFKEFCESVQRRSRILSGITNKTTTAYKRLEASEEEALYKFLNQNLEEMHIILRRLPSLDTFFKSEVPRDQRARLRGIKLEINAVKNSIVKANQKRHEYVARKEEMEQLKRLGINTSYE